MKFCVIFLSLLAVSGFAQQPAEPPSPDTVLAIIDGRKVTYGEIDAYFTGLGPEAKRAAFADRNQLIQQYALFLHLVEYAKAEKLEEKSPYKEAIASTRMAILANAAANYKSLSIPVSAEDQKKYYEDHKDRYVQAKVQVIYLGFVADPAASAKQNPAKKYRSEDEAKTKIAEIRKQIKTKDDFIRLAGQFSEDETSKKNNAEFGTIRKSDNLGPEIKQVIFSLKEGETSGPVAQRNGFYLFRVDAFTSESYEAVRDTIFTEVQTQRYQKWLEEQRAKPIQIENKAFFAK
jgi:peptidyl-prolyl cis-trans isomerase C